MPYLLFAHPQQNEANQLNELINLNFEDVNQRMHQIVIIKTERVILSCLDIIFPDLDKADVVVGKVALL